MERMQTPSNDIELCEQLFIFLSGLRKSEQQRHKARRCSSAFLSVPDGDDNAIATCSQKCSGLRTFLDRKRKSDHPPAVPGLPLIGNLLQLKAKKPHQTFSKLAEKYGPIYSIKTGASSLVILNSSELAKEAMVTRFSSISSRKAFKCINHTLS
ncbi:hypothetical protein H6P81_000197 [Aristolochia fimbriata]|uniref:Cytochrome P450 n=1 Tax=Aristolochia fimbriata TaxID=158543 RepID=A0AAV7F4Q1_ARIFI|nr:hypothetical protein H6P81_000197 [Aristolochia fimbriata]